MVNKNNILICLSESHKTKFGKEDFASQSIPQRVFSSVWAIESEVNNGGFSQYFLNDSCETAAFVVEALETIGALNTAEICRHAISTAFPTGLPADAEVISSEAKGLSKEVLDQLELLDVEFFKYPNNITDLLFGYVVKHPEEFGGVPFTDEY
jgi:hypothetical protein